MKIAFIYDRVNKFGGAERVLQTLHEIWPEAPVFTSVYNPETASWAKGWDIRTSFLQHIPLAKKNHELLGWLMPLAFESLDLSKFDVVISVTSEAAKGIITSARQLHVCYLLTPTRYLWSHAKEYRESLPRVLQPFGLAMQSRLRRWDFIAAQRPDHIIAISKLVQARCLKYYRRKSDLIYPPMQLNIKRTVLGVRQGPSLSEKNYFLIVSRLVPYKRIDLAIAACNELKVSLIVVGTGSDELRLKALAGSTIRFSGHLTDRELIEYYRGAKALLMPQEEDFGLIGIEAQAYGIPVISYSNSGIAEVIANGKTGILFDEQTIKSMIESIHQLDTVRISSKDCIENSQRFSVTKFQETFEHMIKILWKKHTT